MLSELQTQRDRFDRNVRAYDGIDYVLRDHSDFCKEVEEFIPPNALPHQGRGLVPLLAFRRTDIQPWIAAQSNADVTSAVLSNPTLRLGLEQVEKLNQILDDDSLTEAAAASSPSMAGQLLLSYSRISQQCANAATEIEEARSTERTLAAADGRRELLWRVLFYAAAVALIVGGIFLAMNASRIKAALQGRA